MKTIIIFTAALVIAGCDYVPRKIYKIKTVGGEVISLACPTIDRDRNILTYVHEGECVIIEKK